MPVEIVAEVRPFGAVPATDEGWDTLKTFAVGSLIRLRIVRSKSEKALRFYWALVQKVGDSIGIGKYPLSDELLIRTGYAEELIFRNGEVHAKPKSIGAMKHDQFCEYMEAAIKLMCAEYVALTRGELLREIEQMLNLKYADVTKDKDDE